MRFEELPLAEDDRGTPGVLEPSLIFSDRGLPPRTVLCFFQDVLSSLAASGRITKVSELSSEVGVNPIYAMDVDGTTINVVHPGVGAPLAAALLEEMIALGTTRVVAVGGAGALIEDLTLGHPIVVESALRDEGTSFHYAAPSRTIDADPHGVAVLATLLAERSIPFVTGRAWTTDAIYRETRDRVDRRRAEGCIAVDMEASAFMAVARYRGISFAQLLYAGDTLAGAQWDERGWMGHGDLRTNLFELAAAAVVRL